MSFLGDVGKNAGIAASDLFGGALNLLTGSSTAAAPSVPKNSPYYIPAAPKSAPAPQAAAPAGPDWQKMYNDSLAAIQAAQTPIPRFINYDVAGSWAKAKDLATNAVSPIYQQKMADFINRQQVELGRQQADSADQKQGLDQTLSRFLDDSSTSRDRAQEDTATSVKDIQDTQAYNDRTDGLSFDTANRTLSEGLGAAGTAGSGLGNQQVNDAITQRNQMSNEEVRQSTNKIAAQNTLMSRTFDDLQTGDTRKTEDTTAGKAKVDLDLERFIEDQSFDKDQETKSEDASKAADIAQQSISYQGQLVDQWIQSLSGQGYTAQEIANAASMYK